MYIYNRKKEIIKNLVYISLILMIALISTYHIYNKFQGDRSIDFNSDSLDITYHEITGNKLTISKVTPVTDSVGLSSNSYSISIKNNLTEKVHYKVKILDDLKKIEDDDCSDKLISKDNIRISVKIDKKSNKIYYLNELNDNVLLSDNIDALGTRNISIRVWIKQDSTLPLGSSMHYHGTIQIIEADNSVAKCCIGDRDEY